ncbi:restriction endonuclease subunit S [Vibrio ordalii]|uniref:restriction endonuclease subunit S n=1 Tax=Vibrio ordalii TaxID=28174 RepID=UPI000248365F|nr:restriction endonuclease subunit S [Vibrio ordalii]
MKFEDFAQINPKVQIPKNSDVSFVEMADLIPSIRSVNPSVEKPIKGSGSKFSNCDTLFSRITPCLQNGKISQVKNLKNNVGFGSTEFFVFRGKEGVSISDFVYYLFQSELIKEPAIKSMIGASGRQRADLDVIRNIDIKEYSIDDQIQIVGLLSNYDNLIENNNRRIAILEDMAQSLYREWFVNFRYPNHQDNLDAGGKPKLIDSPLGQIPEGWEVKNAAEVITINPKTKLVKEGEKPFVGMSGLSQGSMVIGDIIEKTGNSGAKFINGDTLFARITPCLQNGKTGYVQFLTPEQPVGFGSTEFIVFRESEYLSSEFIYLLSRSNNFREHAIQSMTGATGRQRVHNDCFASCYLPVPPKELMHEFTKLAKPMFKSIFNLSKRNENLKQQRDMLLPKLISGQIELKD